MNIYLGDSYKILYHFLHVLSILLYVKIGKIVL